jgi:outer membrane protein assembly factor BamB
LIGLAACAHAGDWPHWRGPAFNGSSEEKQLPTEWSKTENVVWSAPLPGPGEATPIISGGRVYISSTADGDKDLVALCLDSASGKELWRSRLADGRKLRRQTMASPSPVADAQRSYFLFGTGDLFALDPAGKVLWQRNVVEETGELKILWQYRSSPLLHGGRLYVQVVHGGPSFLIAFDPATGKTLWKQPRATKATGEPQQAYTTPVPSDPGRHARILVAGANALTAHEPSTGKEVWRFEDQTGRLVTMPTPMDDLVFMGRAMGKPMFAVRMGAAKPEIAWASAEPKPDVASPAFYKGLLYVVDDKAAALFCLEPESGATVWREKLPPGSNWASPTAADGKIYCIGSKGDVSVFQAGREPKKLASIAMGEAECLSTIAVADGRLFIRTAKNLYCIGK